MAPRRWLYLSGLALILAAFAGPRVVPLYDGVGFPDQPYQFMNGSNPPSPVEQTVPVRDLDQYTTTLQSLESGPQVQVFFDAGSITLPGGAPDVSLEAKPEAPTSQPTSGALAGNVYLLTVVSTPGPPKITNSRAKVFMRLPQNTTSKTPVVMVHRAAGGQWGTLTTTKTGSDVYEAQFSGVGEYALAINLAAAPPSSSAHSANKPSAAGLPLLLVAIMVGLIAISILVIRLASAKPHDPPRN